MSNDTGGFNGWGEPDYAVYTEAPPQDGADQDAEPYQGETDLDATSHDEAEAADLEFDPQDVPTRRHFEVHDDATAAWAVGKINAARAVLAQREQTAAAWVEEARREVQALEDRFSADLKLWGSQNLPKGRKTIKLMSGKLEFRTKPARFALVRPEEALPWAKAYLPEAVVTKESVSADALTAYAKTGEVPPGVVWQPEAEGFKIK